MEADSVCLVRSIEYFTEIKRQFGFCFFLPDRCCRDSEAAGCKKYGERISGFPYSFDLLTGMYIRR